MHRSTTGKERSTESNRCHLLALLQYWLPVRASVLDHKANIFKLCMLSSLGIRGVAKGVSEDLLSSPTRMGVSPLPLPGSIDSWGCILSDGKSKPYSTRPLAALTALKMQEEDGRTEGQ